LKNPYLRFFPYKPFISGELKTEVFQNTPIFIICGFIRAPFLALRLLF